MIVLFVSSGNSHYGIVPFIKSQGESLRQEGVDVEYFTVKGKGIKGYIRNITPLRTYIKQTKFDIIHAHYGLIGLLCVLAFPGIPIVLSVMGSDAYGSFNDKGKRIKSSYFDMQNALKWYMRRCVNKPNKGTINKFIEVQAKLLSPIVPFVTEEIGEVIGQKGFMSITDWPQIKDVMDDRSEDIIRDTREDINSVLTLLKLKSPKKITLLVAHPWKYELYTILKAELQNSRDFKVLICAVMKNDSLKRYAKDITKIIQKVAKTGIDFVSNQDVEFTTINQSKEFFENEFKAKIEVIKAQDSSENKANQAVPGKVAILVE